MKYGRILIHVVSAAASLAFGGSIYALESPAFRELAGLVGDNAPGIPAIEIAVEVPGKRPPTDGTPYYRELLANNDGSVTVVRPFFRGKRGKDLKISIPISDSDGICGLFDLGPAKSWLDTRYYGRWDPKAAIVDADGRIQSIRKAYATYDLIICGSGPGSDHLPRPTAAERSTAVRKNDNGTITIERPFVAGPEGIRIPIEVPWVNSHPKPLTNGICKYFGLTKAVSSEQETGTGVLASVESGMMDYFFKDGVGSLVYRQITCRP